LVRVGLLYDVVRLEEKMLIEQARSKNVITDLINLDEAVFDLSANDHFEDDLFLQRGISYFRALHSTKILEDKGARVVNNFNTILVAGNKLFTTSLLNKARIPTPRTHVSFSRSSALKSVEKLGYPSVLKPVIGSWGRLVSALNDPESSMAILETREFMHPLYRVYYIQSRVKRPPRDIRAFAIGGQYVAAIFRYAPPGDWRTNTAISGRAEPCQKTPELEELTIKTAETIGGDYLGIDFMESEGGLVVHEVNNCTEFRNTVRVTGVNIPGLIMDYLVSISKS